MALGTATGRHPRDDSWARDVPDAPFEVAGPDEQRIEVRRSARRRRTVSAYRSGDRVVVLLPARLDRAEEQRWVDTMVTRLARREARVRPGDQELERRAAELSGRHLDGAAVPSSVRWTDQQNSRWGSCTPSDRTIRISSRLRGVPSWVLDYVLVHELAHLLEASHDARFWALVQRCPRAERAQGFLEGLGHGAEQASRGDGPQDGDVPGAPDEACTPDPQVEVEGHAGSRRSGVRARPERG